MIFQLITIGLTSTLLALLVYGLLKHFGKKKLLVYFLTPLALFTIGFILRLSKNDSAIDLGYFLTDISNLWLYILFTLVLLLGQIKYWKK